MGTRQRLGTDLRSLVVEYVDNAPEAKATLATGLAMPLRSVDIMLGQKTWDLELAIASIDTLGLSFHVSHD